MGEDAIWLQDKNSVLGFGHTGLLLQDKNGTWHHFYWGNIGTGRKGKRGVTGNLISLGHFSYSNLSLMNNYLNENSIYNGKYEGAIYFEGDFSASVDYAKNLNKNYHLLWDNCMQISVEVLLKGKFEQSNIQYKIFLNKISLNPIPNLAYNRLQSLHNTITQYHSVPWYRKIFRMNPLEAVLLL